MTVRGALVDGARMVARSWTLLLALWAVVVAAAVPGLLLMGQAIKADVGRSTVEQALRERMDMVWLAEFRDRGGVVAGTLGAETTSHVDQLYNLELLLSGELLGKAPGLVAAGMLFGFGWLLLLGGVLDRFARGGGRLLFAPFLAACGRYFGRLLKITLLSLPIYWGLYRAMKAAYGRLAEATVDVTSETTVLIQSLALALPLLALALLVNVVFDLARVASVVDEEPSAWRSLGNAGKLALRHPIAVPALAVVLTLPAPLLVALRAGFDLGADEATWWGIGGVLLVGQLFVIARLAVRLWGTAAQLAFYRGSR